MAVFCLLSNASAVTIGPQQAVPVMQGGAPATASQGQAIQANVTGDGAVAATVQLVVSNDDNVMNGAGEWAALDAGTSLTLSGSAPMSGSFVPQPPQPWRYWGAYLTAISGTSARVTVLLSA